ncbi:hypothetical protein CU098_007107 [Rhizopus stolonifer]|uniref:F-box domain-containing protein n=1 Tax=Rhizopus stolonifer TaxID=4846 RepID=A0A367IN63_RHIST|nr:hypothetical protein CU098_007107 [Rhizopus stolonifer]
MKFSKKTVTYLGSEDRRACQLVCCNWSKALQAAVYEKVVLDSFSQITSFVCTITTSSCHVGNYVKKLWINEVLGLTVEEWDRLDCFGDLVEFCPYLEELKLLGASGSYWVRVMRERYEGNWRYLNKLQFPTSREEIKWYNYVVLSMRDTIKTIIISDVLLSEEGRLRKRQFDMMMSRLHEFE